MIGLLPKNLIVDGNEYIIRSDFRHCLVIMEAFNDNKFSDHNKRMTMLEVLYPEIPNNIHEAEKQAVWFLDCGKTNKSDKQNPKVMDWVHDEQMVFSAINNVAKREIRSDEYCHWWTFIGYYMSIDSDSTFSAITNIRQKLSKGEKLEKHEQKFYAENKELIDLQSSENDYDEMMKALRGE